MLYVKRSEVNQTRPVKNKMNKKGSELTLNTIIITIIAIIVFIVLILVFTGGAGKIIEKFDSIIKSFTG